MVTKKGGFENIFREINLELMVLLQSTGGDEL
jgi:hypothetical protein